MAPLLRWEGEPPALRRPLLVVALEGFVDAGAVASTAASFLRHRWQADRLASFDRDTFVDYRARRPTAVVDAGTLRRVEWPGIDLYGASPGGDHDALFLLGVEPDMQWAAFCDEVVAVCTRLTVEAAIGLGAYPAAVPHSRPVRIMRAQNAAATALVPQAGDIPGYTGPVGAGTVLQSVLAEHGVPAVGLWAEIPHYIAGSPNPGGALAMVQLVAAQLQVEVDTDELEAAAKQHREQVDEAVLEYPDAREMVEVLERHFDAGDVDEQLPSGEDIAAEIERFLRSESD
jgi:proteasome assembly chaperone (PAC2) family protein